MTVRPADRSAQALQQPTIDLGADAVTVADPSVIALTQLSRRDTQALERTGALMMAHERNGQALAGTTKVQLDARNHTVTLSAAVSRDSSTGAGGVGFLLVTPAAAQRAWSHDRERGRDRAEHEAVQLVAERVPAGAESDVVFADGQRGER